MAYEPLHHKYRPQTFGDLVGQETISLTLSNALEQAKIAPAYLFTGPRGTGKTSSARILAKSLNCLNSDRPTPHPCGKCEVCLAIAKGSALDVMEIDAASNTGVDNIREIIERSRFAPVQCRYKIYVVDECLTGDSLVQTSEGLMQIDNPDLKGKQVLSYNENKAVWEYKTVLRWLERGSKKTLTIKTGSSQISCTANHLIRTETGWIEARNVKEGMKIFSPVSADAEKTSTNTERMDEYADSLEDISSQETSTEQNPIISTKFKYKQKPYSLCANADVKKNLIFPTFCNKKEEELKVSNHTGADILTEKVTDSGINEVKTSSILLNNCKSSNLDLFTELYLETGVSNIPIHTVDILDYVGLTGQNSINGWNIKQKDFLKQKTKSLLNGSPIWDILPVQNLTSENLPRENTFTSNWEQNPVENGCQIYNNIPFPQWTTNLETVESVSHASHEQVYDLEVEDNHNFIANGLLVHNCHMLSTAAFNALLKTLEEPPPQVVFILATTDPQRVLSTIISRCQRFDYRRIPLGEMTAHLRYIADAEKIAIADDALTLVAQIANGGLRDAESLLDQLSLLPETITVEKVWDLVGAVPEQDLLKLLQAINSNDSLAVLQQCRSLLDRGREPLVVLQNLAGFYLNLLIAKTAPQQSELTAVTETCWQQLCLEANNWQTAVILRGQQHLKAAETQLKRTTQPRLWLEVTLLGLLPEVHSAISIQPQAVVQSPAKQIISPLPSIVNTPPTISQNIAPQNTATIAPVIPTEQNHLAPTNPAQSPPPPQPVALQNHHQETAMANPTPVAPSNDRDLVANQEIWSKVVSCLQPPTTQALLKQQCHLVSFDGLSAIVGISSAKLQKLNQGKVPNIEAAFAQVCQHKVRVQLEVASSQGNRKQNAIASINQPMVETPPPAPEQPPNPPPPTRVQITPSTENAAIKSQNQASPAPIVQISSAKSYQQNFQESDYSKGLLKDRPSTVAATNTSALTPPTIAADVPSLVNLKINSEIAEAEDYADSDLQQAIASLTQSFEGELVQLDNMDNILDDSFEDDELPQVVDIATLLERPDIAEYTDEW